MRDKTSEQERAHALWREKWRPPAPGYTIIYGLACAITGEVGYVGITIDAATKRCKSHVDSATRAYQKSGEMKPVESWIMSLRRIDVFVIEIVPNRFALEAEEFWIRSLRALGVNLRNVTHGDPQLRRKRKPREMSDARAARELTAFIAETFGKKATYKKRGRPRTP